MGEAPYQIGNSLRPSHKASGLKPLLYRML